MIYRGDPYVTLMASLPAVLFLSEREPPINASRLAERLKDLMPEDQAEIERMRGLIAWSAIDPRLDDAAFVVKAERAIASLRSETLQAAARDRFEVRTLVAALRARHAGEDAPPEGVRWGFGRHVERIRRNWSAPDFGMARLYPWVLKARERLEAGDTAGLERLLLEVAWAAVQRHEQGHEFDLEAVAFYIMRWSIADRWARYDADVAGARFGELLDAAVADALPAAA
jgi:hypothetical protein